MSDGVRSVEEAITRAAGEVDPRRLGLPAPTVVCVTFTGTPEGDVPTVWRVNDAGLSVEVDRDPDAELNLTLAWKDALEVMAGELPPPVAYMQGRLKAAGNMELFLSLMKASAGAEFDSWRRRAEVVAG